ncbi:hypothetical protein UFOVP87_53 [uncultured Caudovirales phage]|uniref:Uncharacterized protein n=1 Tax=uncultured Caudovirales phage TaxID=2100421 RepID=A0A6J5L1L5_9CAUD|nr:hypothetical protein UFOVP87_53 [uncultured Caudovirales phage]
MKAKQYSHYIIIGILIILVWMFLKTCNHKIVVDKVDTTKEVIELKTLYNKILLAKNKNLNLKIDSLSNLKPKVIVRYNTVYDSLLIADTLCDRALITLHDEHTKIDSVNDAIILNQNMELGNYATIVGNDLTIIELQNKRIKQLADSLPIVKRKGYFKGLKQGSIIGLGFGVIGMGLLKTGL